MSRVIARDEVALPHSVEAVYAVLCDLEGYDAWWPRRLSFQVLGPLPPAPGTRMRFGNTRFVTWTAVITELRENELIAMRYDGGACRGTACWRLEAAGAATRIAYEIDLQVHPWWLRALSKVIDFSREHTRQIYRVFLAIDERVHALEGE